MAKSFKYKRVKFDKPGGQKEFIFNARSKLKLSHADFAKLLGICQRTLRDWEKEKFNMAFGAIKIICQKMKIKIPPEDIKILDEFWYVRKGAKKGGLAVLKKYGKIGGNEAHRQKKWKKWWEKEGRFKNNLICKPLEITKPAKSKELAEFIGIILGDGGISKYQVTVTLHYSDDKEYCHYVASLIKKLFTVEPKIRHDKNNSVNIIVISRVELVKFLTNVLGLKQGNKIKQQIDIPGWIKKNKQFQIACVRGLIDTDGSIFKHKYKSGLKIYSYKKLDFCSASAPLRQSVFKILTSLNIKARMRKGHSVNIDSVGDMKKYFSIINSHNPKHLKKYENNGEVA